MLVSNTYITPTLLPVRKVLLPVRKVLLPVRKVLLSVRKVLLPVRKLLLLVRKVLLPVRKVLLPVRKVLLHVRKVLLPVRKVRLLSPECIKAVLDLWGAPSEGGVRYRYHLIRVTLHAVLLDQQEVLIEQGTDLWG